MFGAHYTSDAGRRFRPSEPFPHCSSAVLAPALGVFEAAASAWTLAKVEIYEVSQPGVASGDSSAAKHAHAFARSHTVAGDAAVQQSEVDRGRIGAASSPETSAYAVERIGLAAGIVAEDSPAVGSHRAAVEARTAHTGRLHSPAAASCTVDP